MPKYNSIDNIPAKVFFDILKNKDYQQLKPKPKEKGLEAVFVSIYDAFFLASDNMEAKEYLRLTVAIGFFKWKIATLKQILHFYFYNETTLAMREGLKRELMKGYNIDLDLDKPFADEVERILSIEIGIINNEVAILTADFNAMTDKSKSKDFNYYDAIVGIGNMLQGNSLVKEEMTLSMYVSLEKKAKEVASKQNKKVS